MTKHEHSFKSKSPGQAKARSNSCPIKQRPSRCGTFSYFCSLITRAGTPATTAFAGTSFVTTLPAPTTAFSPMVTPHKIVEPVPMLAPFFTTVGMTLQSASVCSCPFSLVARGYLSLINETLWPIKTWSSIVTPSQINVWLETLTARPILAFF